MGAIFSVSTVGLWCMVSLYTLGCAVRGRPLFVAPCLAEAPGSNGAADGQAAAAGVECMSSDPTLGGKFEVVPSVADSSDGAL